MNLKNILITGGAGFIGVNLVNYLLKQNKYKISVLDNLSTGNLAVLTSVVVARNMSIEHRFTQSPDHLCFVRGDIRDSASLDYIVKCQDQVVHLAGQTGVQPSIEDPEQDMSVNIQGTFNLLELIRKYRVKDLIYASSAAVLGEQVVPITEDKIPRPLSPYGASKLAAEAYCSAYANSFGIRAVILRFSNVYGPFSFFKGSAVAHFIKQIINNKPVIIYGNGNQTRDFLFVDDISRVIDLIINDKTNIFKGEVFQLGSGTETSINHLIDLLRDICQKDIEIIFEPKRNGDIFRNFTSVEKIKNVLNFEPEFDLLSGLNKTWDWFKQNQN